LLLLPLRVMSRAFGVIAAAPVDDAVHDRRAPHQTAPPLGKL
jgi:hypothetical protein